MKTINANTKKGMAMLASAENYEGYLLNDVYSNYSAEKERAWLYCRELCSAENGHNFHICSHNTFQFSVAWETEEGVRIETATNSYLVH